MSKLRSSTFFCAFSTLGVTQRVLDGLVVGHAHALHEVLHAVAARRCA
jgi:hypothetical protein